MIAIKQLLDYFPNELSFYQIMRLFVEGDIYLEAGIVSPSDLKTICEEYELRNIDIQSDGSRDSFWGIIARAAEQAEGRSIEELRATIRTLEGEVEQLSSQIEGQGKTSTAVIRVGNLLLEQFSALVSISESYESLFYIGTADAKIYLDNARAYRLRADRAYEQPDVQRGLRPKGENLLRLADLEIVLGKGDDAQTHLHSAQLRFEEKLKSIRNEVSRKRADENALIGAVYLKLYQLLNRPGPLEKAFKILSDYAEYDFSQKYAAKLARAEEYIKISGGPRQAFDEVHEEAGFKETKHG